MSYRHFYPLILRCSSDHLKGTYCRTGYHILWGLFSFLPAWISLNKKRNLYWFLNGPLIFGIHFKVLKGLIPKYLGDSWNLWDRFTNVGRQWFSRISYFLLRKLLARCKLFSIIGKTLTNLVDFCQFVSMSPELLF